MLLMLRLMTRGNHADFTRSGLVIIASFFAAKTAPTVPLRWMVASVGAALAAKSVVDQEQAEHLRKKRIKTWNEG